MRGMLQRAEARYIDARRAILSAPEFRSGSLLADAAAAAVLYQRIICIFLRAEDFTPAIISSISRVCVCMEVQSYVYTCLYCKSGYVRNTYVRYICICATN